MELTFRFFQGHPRLMLMLALAALLLALLLTTLLIGHASPSLAASFGSM